MGVGAFYSIPFFASPPSLSESEILLTGNSSINSLNQFDMIYRAMRFYTNQMHFTKNNNKNTRDQETPQSQTPIKGTTRKRYRTQTPKRQQQQPAFSFSALEKTLKATPQNDQTPKTTTQWEQNK